MLLYSCYFRSINAISNELGRIGRQNGNFDIFFYIFKHRKKGKNGDLLPLLPYFT